MRAFFTALVILASCSSSPDPSDPPDTGTNQRRDIGVMDASSSKDSAVMDATTREDAGVLPEDGGVFEVPDCLAPTRSRTEEQSQIEDSRGKAQVRVSGADCARAYVIESTQTQRDPRRSQSRQIQESENFPVLRSGNPMFDALYALSIEEVIENSVSEVQDGSFNNGQAIPCPPGGCFETGRLWHYVWTRDTAYATDLALASLDPVRAKNSLEFKLSERRSGGDLQIVQDTGTGGAYPVSTDRVSWALGAYRTLHYLDGPIREEFQNRIRIALNNTLSQDRDVAFDSGRGLYRGETSFLDWREQTYAPWVKEDVVHVGMSQSLSTNLLHLNAIELAAQLNDRAGETGLFQTQSLWAQELRSAIDTQFHIPNQSLYSAYLPTELDPAPSVRFDLLASAFAVIQDVPAETRARRIVSTYPHSEFGPSVIWPQQPDVPIYHNRALWPFVTAYWLKAARRVGHPSALAHNMKSLVHATALNLSNMENLEFTTGLPWVDDQDLSGPVINSERQLWSVAGYLSMVQDIVFGLQTTLEGIRFLPLLPAEIIETWFAGVDRLVLNRFTYRGREIHVSIELPSSLRDVELYEASSVFLNDLEVGLDFIPIDQLREKNLLRIQLSARTATNTTALTRLGRMQREDIFAPRTPQINSVTAQGLDLRVQYSVGSEDTAGIRFHLYRDGQRIARDLPGASGEYLDQTMRGEQSDSHCYAIEAEYISSGLVSQRSSPSCYWGTQSPRVFSVYAGDFQTNGGLLVDQHGWYHYQNWGEPNHTLTVSDFRAPTTGSYYIQAFYGNGSGGLTTGITCALKRLRIFEAGTQTEVGSGYLMMPQTGDWAQWRDSSFVQVELVAGRDYDIVVSQNDYARNMSSFEHFSIYTAGTGGSEPSNFVNIAAIKILSLSGP